MSGDQSQYETLAKAFESWDPMAEAYTNKEFNTYAMGPGASLDSELHTNRSKKFGLKDVKKGPVPFLIFSQPPKDLTEYSLKKICERHGNIIAVRYNKKFNKFFVDCSTVADMQAIFRALEQNTYGFNVAIGKHFKKDNDKPIPDDVYMPKRPQPKEQVEKEQREIYVPDKKPVRNKISLTHMPKHEDYEQENSLLQKNDPQRQLLNCIDDAHTLERCGLLDPNVMNNKSENTMKTFRNGRAFVNVPGGVDNYMKNKFGTTTTGQLSDDGKKFLVNPDKFLLKDFEMGKCSECNATCILRCARCSTFYCSIACQVKSWPEHRNICGNPDRMLQSRNDHNLDTNSVKSSTSSCPSSVGTSQLLSPTFPSTGTIVELTSINTVNVVFLRSKTNEANMEYFKILTEVEKIAKNKNRKPLVAAPKCGQLVLSEFGGKLNRAIALGVNEENDVKINYMDYGNVDIKSFKELYEAPECLSKMPRQAQPVMLKNVPSCYMNDKIRSYMYNCLTRNLIIKYSENDFNRDKNVYQVELFDEELKTNINEHIVKLSKISVPDNDYEFYEINDLKRVELPTGFNVQLVVMDNSVLNVGCITCTTKDFLVEIQKIQDDIQVFVENNPPSKYAPRVNELCIAQYDGDKLWYRGRCCETVGDGFPAIEFFDFGNIGYVNVKNIRRLPKEFLFPIYTHACELEGLPIDDIDEKLVSRLEELIPSCSIINCDHVKYSDSLYTITLNKITEKLQAEGLLKNDSN